MKKKEKVLQFKVIIEQDNDSLYVASVPDLPGCYTQGKTLEEVRERIKEVIKLVLDTEKSVKREKLSSQRPSVTFFGIEDLFISYA